MPTKFIWNQVATTSLTPNFSTNGGQLQRIYIRNSYEYIPVMENELLIHFKTFLPPYTHDDNAVSGLSIISNMISGAAKYFLTYTVRNSILFVSVSWIKPTVVHNARKVIPIISVTLFKKNKRIDENVLRVGAGYWNTKGGKEPAGSHTFNLPQPDDDIITAQVDCSYQALFDVGAISPTPRSKTYTLHIQTKRP